MDFNASSSFENENEGVSIAEHFLDFLDVKSTTGKNQTDVLLQELDELGLQIKDCRGQGYDNGSNMKVELVEVTEDPKANNEAQSVKNEISSYEFLLALCIWYDVLFAVNSVSKNLQAQKMHLGVASQLLQGLVQFFQKFKDEGFVAATLTARELGETLGVEPKFKEARQRKKRRMFEYEGEDEPMQESAEQTFKVEYFYVIADTAAQSLKRRFEQIASYDTMFGFLYHVKELKEIKEDKLFQKCTDLESFLSFEEEKDVCGRELFSELKVLREILPAEVVTAAGILRFMNRI
ncbi:hypothetical protein EVAR_24022_1 [Eumeta japonica]|uniref:Uncharacterized protein n=1 Tax=Eumeta variegata TaxID=151549 RepID=A0A4C1W9Q9_EUMVA|nr:hypothetical protein EVAR_24022_1 [Eumeta japonica]